MCLAALLSGGNISSLADLIASPNTRIVPITEGAHSRNLGELEGVGPLHPGDVVAVKIEGIGTLSNNVMKD